MTKDCARCHNMMQIRDGEEPTPLCDKCAQEVLAKISNYEAVSSPPAGEGPVSRGSTAEKKSKK